MQANAALELTVQMYRKHNIYIDKIVANDGSTMKAFVRYSYDEKEEKKSLHLQWSWPLTNDGKKSEHRPAAFACSRARLTRGSNSPDKGSR
eukprot:10712303-Ditylum_brightwellii.AAC.1